VSAPAPRLQVSGRSIRRRALGAAVALLVATVALLAAAAARADEPQVAPRYEMQVSPILDAESGARLISSAVTATGWGEERLFRPLAPGPGAATARAVRALLWDAPMAWWYGVALHEASGHGGRGREFHTAPGVHLGSPWGGRDSFATFDLEGTSTEEVLYIYAGGTEANTIAATLLERRAVEGVRLRPIDLLYLVSNRLVASDYVLRTTPNPRTRPGRFFVEYSGGGDVARYLGLLHELHGDGSGITSASVDGTVYREYRRLRRQAYWNALDPGLWWALASAMRMTARGDDAPPLPLPRAGRYRFLPVLSSEWTPSGGGTSLEWMVAPAAGDDAGAGTTTSASGAPGAAAARKAIPARSGIAAPRTFSFVARRGRGPSGAFGAIGGAAEDLLPAGRFSLGGSAELWHDPRNGLGGGARLRARLTRGHLRGLYFDVGVKSQGYWIGQPASAGPYAAIGLLNAY
jgi:hypothetical protein